MQEADARYPFVGGFQKHFDDLSPDNHLVSINIKVPVFYDSLGDLLARTPKRTVANYLFWRIAHDFGAFLSSSARSLATNFQRLITGIDKEPAREIVCVNVLKT